MMTGDERWWHEIENHNSLFYTQRQKTSNKGHPTIDYFLLCVQTTKRHITCSTIVIIKNERNGDNVLKSANTWLAAALTKSK